MSNSTSICVPNAKRRRLLALVLLAFGRTGAAQQSNRVARVGWLGWIGGSGARPSTAPLDSLRAALKQRGWTEGRDLTIETRFGESAQARELTSQLLALKVDLIVAQGPMIFGARTVSGSVPLVFTINGDPVEANLVGSLSRPSGSLTGITALTPELTGKRLELLKESLPTLKRVAALGNQAHPGVQTEWREAQAAAQRLGLTIAFYPVRSVDDFNAAFDAIGRDGAQALIAFPDNLINHQAKAIAEFAARARMPTISGWREFAEAGNLLSYGPEAGAFYRTAALQADKLLRGARPADVPVEQPTGFELVINLKAASVIGATLSPTLVGRADLVLK